MLIWGQNWIWKSWSTEKAPNHTFFSSFSSSQPQPRGLPFPHFLFLSLSPDSFFFFIPLSRQLCPAGFRRCPATRANRPYSEVVNWRHVGTCRRPFLHGGRTTTNDHFSWWILVVLIQLKLFFNMVPLVFNESGQIVGIHFCAIRNFASGSEPKGTLF